MFLLDGAKFRRIKNRTTPTGSFVKAALLKNAGNARVVNCLVVGLDAPAHGVVERAVGRLGRRVVQALDRALGQVIVSVNGNRRAGKGHSSNKWSGLHCEIGPTGVCSGGVAKREVLVASSKGVVEAVYSTSRFFVEAAEVVLSICRSFQRFNSPVLGPATFLNLPKCALHLGWRLTEMAYLIKGGQRFPVSAASYGPHPAVLGSCSRPRWRTRRLFLVLVLGRGPKPALPEMGQHSTWGERFLLKWGLGSWVLYRVSIVKTYACCVGTTSSRLFRLQFSLRIRA